MKRTIIVTFLLLFAASTVFAAPEPEANPEAASPEMTLQAVEAKLKYKQGKIVLPGKMVTLDVPPSFRYLGPEDTATVLEQLWGNPPGSKTLGMLFPSDVGPLSADGWGVIISYSDEGHVSDDDADGIDYAEMMEGMKQEAIDSNPQREKMGYSPVNILGWAETPHYDKTSRKLYWAKELKFGDNQINTLNYDIRVLGREGVLVVSAVASMEQLPRIRESMKEVLTIANFNEGHRYADFNPDTDKVAAYGLAALVGGAVAAKSGLLAKLIALLIASKKIVAVAVLGVFAWIGNVMKKKKSAGPQPPASSE